MMVAVLVLVTLLVGATAEVGADDQPAGLAVTGRERPSEVT
ncbi:MAG: hypothetical protein ACKV2O_21350 [Acidimicrobiales bacterium]